MGYFFIIVGLVFNGNLQFTTVVKYRLEHVEHMLSVENGFEYRVVCG